MTELGLRHRGERAVFGVVFLMLFAFSYSEQLVSGVFPSGGGQSWWRIVVIVVDAVVLALVGLMKRSLERADGNGPRLWTWWWAGVVVLLGVDVLRLVVAESIRIDLLSASVYAAAMGVTMAAALNADPVTLFSTARRVELQTDWVRARAVVPLVIGAWLCYLAATAYVDYFDIDVMRTLDPATAEEVAELSMPQQAAVLSQVCEGAISPVFFQNLVGVLPVLLLTLGIEFNYFRTVLTDAGQRAATAATVTVMAAGLTGALSTLPWDGKGCGDVLSSWHEYIAFLFAVQAIFTGLATVVWLLVSSTPDAPAGMAEGSDRHGPG
jgi:hypothetical protein